MLVIQVSFSTFNPFRIYTKALCNGKPAGKGSIKIEAEYTGTASDKTIYPVEDSADALTSPHDPSRTLLNTMGAEKWQTAGQWVSYTFKVDKSGMYDIVFRFKLRARRRYTLAQFLHKGSLSCVGVYYKAIFHINSFCTYKGRNAYIHSNYITF